MFRRDPIRAFGKGSDELDTAARDDEGLEAVRTEVAEQLQLRLVDEVGVEAAKPGVPRRRQPFMRRPGVFVRGHARVGRGEELCHARHARSRDRAEISLQHGPKGLRLAPLRVLRRLRLYAVDGEGELEVDRLFSPQRAVIVEGGDALDRFDVIGAALARDALDEADNRRLRGTVVPGR